VSQTEDKKIDADSDAVTDVDSAAVPCVRTRHTIVNIIADRTVGKYSPQSVQRLLSLVARYNYFQTDGYEPVRRQFTSSTRSSCML
jgi:hypothetical protein